MTNLNPVFTTIYTVGGVSIVTTEIYALATGREGATVSEHWRAVDRSLSAYPGLQWTWRIVTSGFLAWLGAHTVGAAEAIRPVQPGGE